MTHHKHREIEHYSVSTSSAIEVNAEKWHQDCQPQPLSRGGRSGPSFLYFGPMSGSENSFASPSTAPTTKDALATQSSALDECHANSLQLQGRSLVESLNIGPLHGCGGHENAQAVVSKQTSNVESQPAKQSNVESQPATQNNVESPPAKPANKAHHAANSNAVGNSSGHGHGHGHGGK